MGKIAVSRRRIGWRKAGQALRTWRAARCTSFLWLTLSHSFRLARMWRLTSFPQICAQQVLSTCYAHTDTWGFRWTQAFSLESVHSSLHNSAWYGSLETRCELEFPGACPPSRLGTLPSSGGSAQGHHGRVSACLALPAFPSVPAGMEFGVKAMNVPDKRNEQ